MVVLKLSSPASSYLGTGHVFLKSEISLNSTKVFYNTKNFPGQPTNAVLNGNVPGFLLDTVTIQ